MVFLPIFQFPPYCVVELENKFQIIIDYIISIECGFWERGPESFVPHVIVFSIVIGCNLLLIAHSFQNLGPLPLNNTVLAIVLN